MTYVAAFRNHDGTIHRERFSAATIDRDLVLSEATRIYGVMPVEISDTGTGEILFRERRVK